MSGLLYAHQQEGAAWLRARPGGRGYLAFKPGLGKTRTVLAALEPDATVLVVCPAIVRTHWRRERDLVRPDVTMLVKSYEEITRYGDRQKEYQRPTLILDEAHYLRHVMAQRTKILLGAGGYARTADRVYLASGTPLPRNPSEIWPVLASCFPHVARQFNLGSQDQFNARYCVMGGTLIRGTWKPKVLGIKRDHEQELQALLGEILLVKTLDDVGLDVPTIDWQILRLDAPVLDADLVEGDLPEREFGSGGYDLESLAGEEHIATMRRRLGEMKAPLVAAMLMSQLEADPKMKVAVFAYHRSVLAELRTKLGPYRVAYVDGDTPALRRDHEIDRFNDDCRVFVGQSVACSTGMDGLQHATNRAVVVEPDWSADVNYQLGHRVARIGASHGRAIVQMVALAGTLDEAIVAQNKRETEMVERAMARKGA